MKILYAPWRSVYVPDRNQSCIFCTHADKSDSHYDQENLIIKRFEHNMVIMNLYPYNAGHLLIVPYEHTADLSVLKDQARKELIDLTGISINILKASLNNQATNVGLNLGKISGGTIPDHLHMHVVPRWEGDTGFMPILTDIKQISFDMKEIYKKLKVEFDKI